MDTGEPAGPSKLYELAEHVLVNQYTQPRYLHSNLRMSIKKVHQLLATLERIGIVGPATDSGDREILYSYFQRHHALATVDAHEAECASQVSRRVLVTGSRTWTDNSVIRDALAKVWHPTTILVIGFCELGADKLAEQCWTAWGGQIEPHPADWATHGRSAGFLRNTEMVESAPDECIAFIRNQSRGATDCATKAQRAGIPTTVYRAA